MYPNPISLIWTSRVIAQCKRLFSLGCMVCFCGGALAQTPLDLNACPQKRAERLSNMGLAEFRQRFGNALAGRSVEVEPLAPGINLFRIANARPGEFLFRSVVDGPSGALTVRYSEPNYVIALRTTPGTDDPNIQEQYGLQKIGAVEVWQALQHEGLRDIAVAIVDSGAQNEDLETNLWGFSIGFTIPLGSSNPPIDCPVGSREFDALVGECTPQSTDGNGHGTHVAGIIGADGSNGLWGSGVNKRVTLLSVRAFDAKGRGSIDSIVRGFNFILAAAEHSELAGRIRIVNNSWGYSGTQTARCRSDALFEALTRLIKNDMLVIAAADNSPRNLDEAGAAPYYLTAFQGPGLIGVSATNDDDGVACSYGLCSVDLRAPGIGVDSTLPPPRDFGSNSGTSMAAAFVSGAAALVLSACPDLKAAALKELLTDPRNLDLIKERKYSTRTGGRLNVKKAIERCRSELGTSKSGSTRTTRAGERS